MVNFRGDPGRREQQQPRYVVEEAAEQDEQLQQQQHLAAKVTLHGLCDFCGESRAPLYCRADTAKLCFSCDREVHSGNPLFGKHSRSQLCDACASKPASIFCSTDNLVLCQNCDWDAHGGCSSSSSSSLHDRRPLEGFSGCPSAVDLSSILGFEDVGNKPLLLMGDAMDDCLVVSGPYGSMGMADSFTDELVRDTPVVSLDDLIVSSDSTHNFQPMVVPPLPKSRKSACGKHKEEILRQLCKLARLERSLSSENGVVESFLGLQPSVQERSFQTGYVDTGIEHETGPTLAPGFDVNALQWHGDYSEAADQVPILITFSDNRSEENFLVLGEPGEDGSSGSHTNVGCKEQSQHPIIRESLQGLQKVGQHEPTRIDRDLAISRYKEKKKARRYNKHIWYESRNVRAEGRTRIKGRFAKAND